MKARIFTDRDVRKMLDKSVKDAAEMGVTYGERNGLKQGAVQGIAICMLVLELDEGWKKQRLTRFYENINNMLHLQPMLEKTPTAENAINRMRDLYQLDIDKLDICVEV